MLNEILPRIPLHDCYVEPFFGGGAVFFAKEKAPLEVINDTNSEVINFYKVLKLNYKQLNKLVQTTLHSRATYVEAKVIYQYPHLFSQVRRAWAFWTLTSQGFAGKIGSWGYDKRPKGSMATTINNRKIQFGPDLSDRLSTTQIECKDALQVIANRDHDSCFMYIDPPYFNSDLGHYKGYSANDFNKLLELLKGLKSKWLMSSYPSELLTEHKQSNKWFQLEFDKNLSASKKGNSRKIEVLTANYEV